MTELITGFLKFVSIGQRTAFIIGLGAWIFLALPQPVTAIVDIPNFRMWVWLTAYASSVIFIIGLLYDFADRFIKKRTDTRKKRIEAKEKTEELSKKQAKLRNLTAEEKTVLEYFIKENRRSISLPENKATLHLEELDILYVIPKVIVSARKKANLTEFHISEWAYRYLLENPYLLSKHLDN